MTPRLSIVVIVYNMRREAPRTLRSLSADYQQGVDAADYEVLVVENGSSEPLDEDLVASFGSNFRYRRVEHAAPSPVPAVNLGVHETASPWVGVMIDGARIVTPGLVAKASSALEEYPRPVVATLGFHLGPDLQYRSIDAGYGAAAEDRLLDSISWPDDGYRLFEIAVLAESSQRGWTECPDESNCVFVTRDLFEELGGFDEAFDLPGGGMANLDFWARACELPDSTLVTLVGEGCFHQVHGGVATNAADGRLAERLEAWSGQYASLRGRPYVSPTRKPLLLGELPGPTVGSEGARPDPSAPPDEPPRDLSDRLEQAQAETTRLRTELARAQATVEAADLARAEAEAKLTELLSSRSWRLTAPLRKLLARRRGD